MSASGFGVSEVREHYKELASEYDARANVACSRAYRDLVRRALSASRRVLEIGSGTSSMLPALPAPRRTACDASLSMVAAQPGPIEWERVVADGQILPFRDGAFDGIFAINVAEHVPDPTRLLSEAHRVLSPGGRLLLVTPNGDLEWLLDALERLRLKLPEGPHRFLRYAELGGMGRDRFHVLDHRCFLALPVGPPSWVGLVDRVLAGKRGRGLFQYIVLEKVESRSNGR